MNNTVLIIFLACKVHKFIYDYNYTDIKKVY